MTKKLISQPIGRILQLAYIAQDLEAEANRWVEMTGAGPFFLVEHIELINKAYHGKPTDVDVSIALGFSGAVCVELICQTNDAPSVYRDVNAMIGGSFHHWGITTEKFDEEVARYEQAGYPLVFSGGVTAVEGARFAFMDTVDKMGGLVELIETTPVVSELFGEMEAAAKNWDGKDPIRQV